MRASQLRRLMGGMVRSALCRAAALTLLLVCAWLPQTVRATEYAQVEDGVYAITSALSGNALDIAAARTSNGANVQTWEANGTFAQYWRVTRVDGHYAIVNSLTGVSLDVAGGRAMSGTNVQIYEANGTKAQLWDFVRRDDGTYAIVSALDGRLALDVAGASPRSGANVWAYAANGTKAQSWRLCKVERALDDGLYTIASSLSPDRVLDVRNGSAANGAAIQLWSPNGTASQTWSLSWDERTGFYTLLAAGSAKSLDVPGAQGSNGVRLQQYDANGARAQAWAVRRASDGSYVITSVVSGRAIDVPGAHAGQGSAVQLWDANGSRAQGWSLTPTTLSFSGTYRIGSVANEDGVLDVRGASMAQDATVQVWEANGTLAQTWELVDCKDGTHTLRSANSGRYLADEGGALASLAAPAETARWKVQVGRGGYVLRNAVTGRVLAASDGARRGAVVSLRAKESGERLWKLVPAALVGEGTYVLYNRSAPGQVLDVPGGTAASYQALQTYGFNDSGAQKWVVKAAGNGFYTITNASSNLALDVRGASAASGTVVQQYTANGTKAQLWRFVVAPSGGVEVVSALGSGTLALTTSRPVAANGVPTVVSTCDPAAGPSFSWNLARTTFSRITEVADVWGDPSYVAQMRARATEVGSSTPWVVLADKARGRATVFFRSGGSWVLANSMDIRTGGNTFTGTFKVYITARGYWKWPDCDDVNDWYVGYMEDWWERPSSSHMREVPGRGYDEGQGFHYGYVGSGCITVEDKGRIKWMHDNVTVGSTVSIF
ncbi:RICIN domain-containing protein [Olsenella sp. HMSC062G07]|uniref:RICIN domain-containing protein n=1 Tax=Olsenella sp. HMSC062G07 TaxID=1739330 RepID=UPI0008A2015E|nr:RICIN domain-containing protein [Olsenella sp. HMSC062G07]OFK24123.1 hypothetical protein HMPREF2826_08335 [Olsenella sp. HMSC062G07]